jgi:hypothetical protein
MPQAETIAGTPPLHRWAEADLLDLFRAALAQSDARMEELCWQEIIRRSEIRPEWAGRTFGRTQ